MPLTPVVTATLDNQFWEASGVVSSGAVWPPERARLPFRSMGGRRAADQTSC